MTLEEAQRILRERRTRVKEYYTRTNEEILQSLDLSAFDASVSASSYATYLNVEFEEDITEADIHSIYELAECEVITKIYVKSTSLPKSNLTTALNAIDGTGIVANASTDGSGIIIGILDSGIVDINNECFAGVNELFEINGILLKQ